VYTHLVVIGAFPDTCRFAEWPLAKLVADRHPPVDGRQCEPAVGPVSGPF